MKHPLFGCNCLQHLNEMYSYRPVDLIIELVHSTYVWTHLVYNYLINRLYSIGGSYAP